MKKAKNKKINLKEKKIVSITEAARLHNVTRQAIYVAIKLNKLKAKKDKTRWTIRLEDLANYRRQRYSRSKSTYKGELLFDNDKGYYSVAQVAKLLNVPAQKIYYATRAGMLTASRRGSAWVLSLEEVKKYATVYLRKRLSRKLAG